MGVNIARLHQQAACKFVIHCFKYNNRLQSKLLNHIFHLSLFDKKCGKKINLFLVLYPLPAALMFNNSSLTFNLTKVKMKIFLKLYIRC